MKKTLLLSVAVLGLAGLAGCAETPPPPPPMAEAPPPPPPAPETRGPVDYVCRGKKAGDIMATFIMSSPETVQLTYGDQSATATRVTTKRGMLYKADGVSFSVSRNVATVNWMGKKLVCTARKA